MVLSARLECQLQRCLGSPAPLPPVCRCPRGWTSFDGIIDGDKNYREWYYKPVFSANCSGVWTPNGTYHQTDIVRDKGLAYIE